MLLRILSIVFVYSESTNIKKYDSEKSFLYHLMKSIILASIAKFFLIPIVIWNNNTTDLGVMLHLVLVNGYYFLSLLNVYSGKLNKL